MNKLEEVEQRFERLNVELANPEVLANAQRMQKLAKEHASLEKIVEKYRAWKKTLSDIQAADEFLRSSDMDLKSMAKEELPLLEKQREALEQEIHLLLLPKDPNDEKNVIVEIRAGAGGDESALFAEEVMQMYLRFAQKQGWTAELWDLSSGNAGGLKEAAFSLSGQAVFSWMRYESGVHRVQRVPDTETQGRIHTSTITVAVMPEAEDVEVEVNMADVEMQVFRSTGSGGQSVNTTDSAVRLIHKPTGIVVKCQQEKSQTKNRAMAMKILKAKLLELEQDKQQKERDNLRKGQVGTADRSEKIRTYNFPQDRLTDHRIGLTLHNLPSIMMGNLEDMVIACRTYFQAEALRHNTANSPGIPPL
ncbi:MAG: peptide chain release factor 1 [Cystobacterineae bacterium]|nr:peptide chain release factor 1 [Cystobacterineae bacterium]